MSPGNLYNPATGLVQALTQRDLTGGGVLRLGMSATWGVS